MNHFASAAVATIGRHHPDDRAGRLLGEGQGGELIGQHVRIAAGGAEAADAECRIGLALLVEERQRLVGPGVERPDHDLAAGHRLEDGRVQGDLLVDGRRILPVEVEELGAEEADTLGVDLGDRGRPGGVADVEQQRDRVAVGRPTGPATGGPRRATPLFVTVGLRGLVRRDPDADLASAAVDLDELALAQQGRRSAGDDRRQAEAPGQDRRVARRSALDRHERQHPLRGQRHGVGRGEVVGDEDERGVALGDAGHRQPEQSGDGPIADVVEVPDPLRHVATEIEEQRPEGVDRPIDRPRRRLALGDRRADRLLERRVAGDHRGRFEHLRRAGDRGRGRATLEVVGGEAEGRDRDLQLGVGVGDLGVGVGQSRPWTHERHRPRRAPGTDADSRDRRRRRARGPRLSVGDHHVQLTRDRRGPRRPRVATASSASAAPSPSASRTTVSPFFAPSARTRRMLRASTGGPSPLRIVILTGCSARRLHEEGRRSGVQTDPGTDDDRALRHRVPLLRVRS